MSYLVLGRKATVRTAIARLDAPTAGTSDPPQDPDPVPTPTNADMTKHFESGQTYGPELYCSGNCPTVSSARAYQGNNSARFYLHRTNSSTSYRTELTLGSPYGEFVYGNEYWIGFAQYLENWIDDGWGEILWQFHGRPDLEGEGYRQPNIGLFTNFSGGTLGNTEFDLIIRGDSRFYMPDGSYERSKTYTFGDYLTHSNVWKRWVMRYIPNYTSAGVFQLWIDDQLVVDDAGANCFNDATGPYFKLGIYKSAWNGSAPWTPAPGELVTQERIHYKDLISYYQGASGYNAVDPAQFL